MMEPENYLRILFFRGIEVITTLCPLFITLFYFLFG